MTIVEDRTRQVEEAAPPAALQQSPRAWPRIGLAALLGAAGGMLALVLILTLAISPRAVPGSAGDPAAGWDSSIILTDAYLTAQARAGGGGQIQDPRLHVVPDGTVTLDGRSGLLVGAAPIRATLRPTVVDGALRMTVVSAQLGVLPLPEPLSRQIEAAIAASLQAPPTTVPTAVVRVETKDGQLILYNKVK
jgi:hypothetical protein